MNIDQLLEITVERRASDLHLAVGHPPMIRINGELLAIDAFPKLSSQEMQSLLITILKPKQKEVFEKNLELDFGLSFQEKARFRVNIFLERGNLAAAFRLIPLQIPLLEGLGLPEVVSKLTNLKQGLILVTGPTGHGKSTTLAAFINKINLSKTVHILTVEDPIEYVYPKGKALVSQREMLADTYSWSGALRSALREDPDVVLVGEMRDYETIAATITIAETGHLVLATLHTNSAAQSVDRIVDTFPSDQQSQIRIQLASTLQAIVSQRLIPTIIPGRTLAVELLLGNPALSSLIREGKSHLIDNLIQTSGELGMISLESSLARLVKNGRVSFEVAQSYSLRPDLFAKMLGG